jgi:hypothetical protein
MLVNGRTANLRAKAPFTTQMATFTRGTSKMEAPTAMASTITSMAQNMKALSKMILRKDLVKNNGKTVAFMKEILRMDRSMGTGNMCGLMGVNMWALGFLITLEASAPTNGQMAVPLRAVGRTTRCTARDSTRGLTDGNMMASISMT